MNKALRIVGTSIAAVAMVFNLSSCGDGDEPGGNGDSAGKINPGKIFTAGLPKKVGNNVLTYNSSGLLTTVSNEYGVAAEFSYQDGIVVMTEEDCKAVFEIGDNGFASKVTINYVDEAPYYCEFTYNSDGQMTSATYVDEDGRNTTTLTYENGDVTKSVGFDNYDQNLQMTRTYGYGSNIENKSGIMMFDLIYGIDFDSMEMAYYAGILGMPTKHLPETETYKEENIATGAILYSGEYRYKWTMNGNGLPTYMESYYTTTSGEEYKDDYFAFEW